MPNTTLHSITPLHSTIIASEKVCSVSQFYKVAMFPEYREGQEFPIVTSGFPAPQVYKRLARKLHVSCPAPFWTPALGNQERILMLFARTYWTPGGAIKDTCLLRREAWKFTKWWNQGQLHMLQQNFWGAWFRFICTPAEINQAGWDAVWPMLI